MPLRVSSRNELLTAGSVIPNRFGDPGLARVASPNLFCITRHRSASPNTPEIAESPDPGTAHPACGGDCSNAWPGRPVMNCLIGRRSDATPPTPAGTQPFITGRLSQARATPRRLPPGVSLRDDCPMGGPTTTSPRNTTPQHFCHTPNACCYL
jgi:hypothetical protein